MFLIGFVRFVVMVIHNGNQCLYVVDGLRSNYNCIKRVQDIFST